MNLFGNLGILLSNETDNTQISRAIITTTIITTITTTLITQIQERIQERIQEQELNLQQMALV